MNKYGSWEITQALHPWAKSTLRLLQRYWELNCIFPWEPNSKAINQAVNLSTQQNNPRHFDYNLSWINEKKPWLGQTQLSLNLKKTGAKVNLWQDLPSYDPARTTSDFKSINEGGKKLQYIINRSYQFLKCDGVCRAHRNVSWWINVQRCEKPQIYSVFKPSSQRLFANKSKASMNWPNKVLAP